MSTLIKVKRGLESSIKSTVLSPGEPAFSLDTHKLFLGDGSVTGGYEIGSFRPGINFSKTTEDTNFTIAPNQLALIDTSLNPVQVTLPLAPTVGDTFRIVDSTGSFDDNNVTLTGNGEDINGSASDLVLSDENGCYVAYYDDVEETWWVFKDPGEGWFDESVETDFDIVKHLDLGDPPYTAEDGAIILADTTGGVITVTAPANPELGDKFQIQDFAENFGTNEVIVDGNGINIAGLEEFSCDVSGQTYTFILDKTPEGNIEWVVKTGRDDNLTLGNTITGTTETTGDPVLENITQVSHGFAVGDAVTFDGSDYVKAVATSEEDCAVVGFVSEVKSPDIFTVVTGGLLTDMSGLTPGATYYLSPTTPGAITDVKPTEPGQFVKPLFVATSTTTGIVSIGDTVSNTDIASTPMNNISQAIHGFAVGDAIRHNGTIYIKAQATSAAGCAVVGVVSDVLNANTFSVVTGGLVTGLSGLTAGTTYYLSAATAGLLTATAPSTIGQYVKPVLIAISTTSGIIINQSAIGVNSQLSSLEYGCTLSNNSISPNSVIDFTSGARVDSTYVDRIIIGAMTKTLAIGWAAGTGNNGIDTGSSVQASAWYHVFMIKNLTTDATDVLFSLSATSPTMPSGYTLKCRVGAVRTNVSRNIIPFKQKGRVFEWVDPVYDYMNNTLDGTATITSTLPTGVSVIGRYVIGFAGNTTGGEYIQLYPMDINYINSYVGQAGSGSTAGADNGGGYAEVRTNSSGQIKITEYGLSTIGVRIFTIGWIDKIGTYAGE